MLADPENVTPGSEAARLNRTGEPSPADHLAVMYGKSAGGRPWQLTSLKNILLPEAALGYLKGSVFGHCRTAGEPVCPWVYRLTAPRRRLPIESALPCAKQRIPQQLRSARMPPPRHAGRLPRPGADACRSRARRGGEGAGVEGRGPLTLGGVAVSLAPPRISRVRVRKSAGLCGGGEVPAVGDGR